MATTTVAGEPLQALTCKTWVLKVSIHCEGCKKKVKKVLHSIEGVYATNIDTKQQKVLVVGNVEATTLIDKLVKSGKNAELWPEPITQKEKKPGKSKKKEKHIDQNTKTVNQDEGCKEPKREKSTVEVEEIPQETVKKVEVNPAQAPKRGENSDDVAETKASGQSPEAVENSGESNPCNNVSGCKKEKKKKKRTKQRNLVEGGPSNTAAPALSESAPPVLTHHYGYEYPPYYHAPPPVYAVSYNTAYPSAGSSYTASYYASPPPLYSYAYTHTGLQMQPPPSDLDSYPRQPLDSFEMFSDENSNRCFIM